MSYPQPGQAHILLTKFNVQAPYLPSSRPGLDVAWLERRLKLFTSWTVRSVALQTRAPSAWLVFVDSATPATYLTRLRAVCACQATIVLIEGVLTDEGVGDAVHS